jgi:serine/threonine protein kinase
MMGGGRIEHEFRLLENLKHPHIVTYIDALRHEGLASSSACRLLCLCPLLITFVFPFSNGRRFLHIILEYCENGALSSLLAKVPPLPPFGFTHSPLIVVWFFARTHVCGCALQFGEQPPEQLVAHYIEESLKGLCYLHQQGGTPHTHTHASHTHTHTHSAFSSVCMCRLLLAAAVWWSVALTLTAVRCSGASRYQRR